jgi:hypothetical protein
VESFQGFTISILLHLVLFLAMIVYSYERPIEFKEVPTWLAMEEQKDSPQMGEETKRVEKETRTRETSPTTVTNLRPETPSSQSFKDLRHPTYGGQTRSDIPTHLQPTENDLFMRQSAEVSQGMRQQLQSFLPRDLEIGDVVALNTDQNLFFTFYRRMAEKIIWPWAQSVSAGFERMRATGQLGGTPRAWITTVEVVLDKKGQVISTQPLQLAGDGEIDSAPINAFNSAKIFPNPPVEMVDEDGYIRIRYKFVVYYNPGRGP